MNTIRSIYSSSLPIPVLSQEVSLCNQLSGIAPAYFFDMFCSPTVCGEFEVKAFDYERLLLGAQLFMGNHHHHLSLSLSDNMSFMVTAFGSFWVYVSLWG